MPIIHHEQIRRRVRLRYALDDLDELLGFLQASGTLRFRPLATGLYPAADLHPEAAWQTGYGSVWVRDNVFVAFALEAAGQVAEASAVAVALATFFLKHRRRFERIIDGQANPHFSMNRPHIRFDGAKLAEHPSEWAHAQNDALGYFLWLYCGLARQGRLTPDSGLLTLFVLYFESIRYWRDRDSGHWEEAHKVEASSIGVVVAGLRSLRELLAAGGVGALGRGGRAVTLDRLDDLIRKGEEAMDAILPSESLGPPAKAARRHDAALLFLIQPLEVVNDDMARRITDDVVAQLQGDYGVRRYLGDSYWTADYKHKVPADQRTAEVSGGLAARDALARPGEEAQWSLFDPVLSIAAGRRYLRTGDPAELETQVRHFNRSLGQITGEDCPQGALRCPEAYYLERGRYVANDHVPLLWTQANLLMALLAMRRSASAS
jgi:hypothetical protein